MQATTHRCVPLLAGMSILATGILLLQPNEISQYLVSGVSLFLLGYLPWTVDSGLKRSWTGVLTGFLLGGSISAALGYLPIIFVCVATGWLNGLIAEGQALRKLERTSRLRFDMRFLFSLITLFAVVFAVWGHQRAIVSSNSTALAISEHRIWSLRPQAAEIVISVDNQRRYVIGKDTIVDARAATEIVFNNVSLLEHAGVCTENITLVGLADDARERNLIGLLRLCAYEDYNSSLNIVFRAMPKADLTEQNAEPTSR